VTNSPVRPYPVVAFEVLSYISIGLIFISFALVGDIVGGLWPALLMALFIWLIARKRQKWARWVLLLMWVLGTIAIVLSLGEVFQAAPVLSVLPVAQILLQGASVVLLYLKSARLWFRDDVALPS
jgi:hypothetical protein